MALRTEFEKKTRYPGIVQIGNGRFRIRARFIDHRTGRRRQRIRVFEGTLTEAVIEQARLQGEEVAPLAQARQRLRDYAESWLRYKAVNVRPGTGETWAWQIGHHIFPFFGDYWLDAVTPGDVRQWQVHLKGAGMAAATVNSIHRTLRSILDAAQVDGLIAANPAKAVPRLREGRTKGARGTVLSPHQLGQFLATGRQLTGEGVVSADLFSMLVTLALCGLRFGEAAALQWGDIRQGMASVQRSVRNRHVGTTKTDDPRTVLLPDLVVDHLQEQRRRLLAEQHPALALGLVFPASQQQAKAGAARREATELNWYRYPSCLKKPIAAIVREVGLPPISPHSLRRTWDRWTRWAGVDYMARRAMAGWRTEEAHAIYTDVDPEEARPAMEAALKKMLAGDH